MIDGLVRSIGAVARKVLVGLRVIEKPAFIGRYADERPAPDALRDGEVVIVGTNRFHKWACFPCPDGCGDTVALNLSRSRRPTWGVELDWMSRVTVHPSIHEKTGCLSHYWIKGGEIVWCADSGRRRSGEMESL